MQTSELIADLKRLLSEGQDGDKGRHMFILVTKLKRSTNEVLALSVM